MKSLAVAAATVLTVAPTATGAKVNLGSTTVSVPDLPPVFVTVPPGYGDVRTFSANPKGTGIGAESSCFIAQAE